MQDLDNIRNFILSGVPSNIKIGLMLAKQEQVLEALLKPFKELSAFLNIPFKANDGHLQHLVNRENLFLSTQRLTSLPPYVELMPRLKKLSLSCNRFKTVPLEIKQMTSLVSLDLSDNAIDTIPAWIAYLHDFDSLS